MFSAKKRLSVKASQDEILFLMESGYLSRDLGRSQAASDIFLGVSALVPHEPLPLAAIGTVLVAEGRYDEAVRHLEKALAVFPDDPLIEAHLGEALLYLKENARARKLFERSIQAQPKGPGAEISQSYLSFLDAVEKK